MKLRLLAPAGLLIGTSACFATRNDVRILQGDIFALRAQQAQADSARARQMADIAASLSTTLGVMRDSVRDVSSRLTSFQGATRQELYNLGQQLGQLGALMGQSESALRNFRVELEERNRQLMEQAVRAAVPAPAPGDTAKPVVPPPTLGEGPHVLYQIGRDQLSNRAWAAARDAFTKLIADHPTSDRVPLALAGIADAFDAEGNVQQGDSVYRLVVQKYPSNEAAATSQYKLGMSLARQGKRAEARAAMQKVVRDYPGSDPATLATDWLTRNPG